MDGEHGHSVVVQPLMMGSAARGLSHAAPLMA